MKKIGFVILVMFTLFMGISCSDFLEDASQDLVIPQTVEDMEGILVYQCYLKNPADIYLEYMTDDIQSNEAEENDFQAVENIRWAFTWEPRMVDELEKNAGINSWSEYYNLINRCNVIIDHTPTVMGDEGRKEFLIAQAMGLRAYYYLMLVNIYSWPYNDEDHSPDEADSGVPLMLNMYPSDALPYRNTTREVYARIEKDLLEAERIFTETDYAPRLMRHEMSLDAVRAILSRVYLYMERYDDCITYANKVMDSGKYMLMDLAGNQTSYGWNVNLASVYNLTTSSEVIWNYGSSKSGTSIFKPNAIFNKRVPASVSTGDTPSALFTLYDTKDWILGGNFASANNHGDLRAQYYFTTQNISSSPKIVIPFFYEKDRGADSHTQLAANGVRIAELYLNRAECYIAKYLAEGNVEYRKQALADLNELRCNRYDTRYEGNFQLAEEEFPELLTDNEALVQFCRDERRRELCGESNHRWFDLKRYGMPELVHDFYDATGNKTRYVLPAKSNGYLIPIAQSVLDLNQNLKQNPLFEK